jgi:hypothetical protein
MSLRSASIVGRNRRLSVWEKAARIWKVSEKVGSFPYPNPEIHINLATANFTFCRLYLHPFRRFLPRLILLSIENTGTGVELFSGSFTFSLPLGPSRTGT